MLEREGVTSGKIVVTVRRNRARVRWVVYDDWGRVKAKYGLTVTGGWVQVPEGEAYPDECRLRVRRVDWLPRLGHLKGWLLCGIWSLRSRLGKRKDGGT